MQDLGERNDVYTDDAKEKENGKSSAGKGGAGGYNMTDDEIVDHIETSSPSAVSEERGAAISRPVEEMAFLCCVYDVVFRKVEKTRTYSSEGSEQIGALRSGQLSINLRMHRAYDRT